MADNTQKAEELPYTPDENAAGEPPAPPADGGSGSEQASAFGRPPGSRTYITIGGDGSTRWHTWDKEKKQQSPIEDEAILGQVTGVEIRTREYEDAKYDASQKTHIHLKTAGGNFVLTAGASTVFMRYAIGALLSGEVEAGSEVWIAPKIGDDDKVILPEVSTADGDRVIVRGEDVSEDPVDDVKALAEKIGQDMDPTANLKS